MADGGRTAGGLRATLIRRGPVRLAWMCARPPGDVIVYASKVAAVAGLNRFEDPAKLRLELLRALGAPGAADFKTDVERADAAVAALPAATRAAFDGAAEAGARCAVAGDAGGVQAVLAASSSALPPEVRETLRSRLYTTCGTAAEAGVRGAIERAAGSEIAQCARFECRHVLTAGDLRVSVGGKHDGLQAGRLVEIKTRQRAFLGVPEYERVQVHAYMHVFGTRSAVLVESYRGETREHEVPFDDELWADVVARLAAFVAGLDADFGEVAVAET